MALTFEKDKIPLKGYIFLSLTLVAGVLTHYYFLFVAFAGCAWYTVKLFLKKRYVYLFRYLTAVFISAVVSLGIYPSTWTHIFEGGRGVEAGANFMSFGGDIGTISRLCGGFWTGKCSAGC